MCSSMLDVDVILSGNEQWSRLEQQWGDPIDLETEDDPPKMSPAFSTHDVQKSTFDSSFIFKKDRKHNQLTPKNSVTSKLDYQDFIEDLKDENISELPLKQFYFIQGQILSALSLEEICDKIDDIFKSVEKLCSATSTIRKSKPTLPERVQCSIDDVSDLSFDESDDEREKKDSDDVSKYIDEAFDQLNATINTINNLYQEVDRMDQSTKDSVTTLVRKFSTFLTSPAVNRSPRRKRQCNEKFKDLAEFWKKKSLENH